MNVYLHRGGVTSPNFRYPGSGREIFWTQSYLRFCENEGSKRSKINEKGTESDWKSPKWGHHQATSLHCPSMEVPSLGLKPSVFLFTTSLSMKVNKKTTKLKMLQRPNIITVSRNISNSYNVEILFTLKWVTMQKCHTVEWICQYMLMNMQKNVYDVILFI